MKPVVIIAIVAVAMIGVMVPNVFAQSIVDEKDCKIIGEELDSNIECRYLLKTPEGLSIDLELDQGSARYYDQEKNILYFGERWNEVYDEDGNRIEVTLNAWKHNYVGVELDTLTIVDQLHCEPIITGTYEKIVTYPCELELEIESKDHKLVLPSKRDWIDHPNAFVQYEENVIFAETYYAKGDRSYAIALFDYNGNKIRWLHDEPSHAKAFGEPNRANIDALIVSQTKTTTPYIYYVIYGDGKSHSKTGGLHVMQGEKPFSILHSYNTDLKFGGKIFLNEEKNQVYYLVGDVMYKIKGMGHLKPTGIASFVDQSKDPQHYIDRYNNEPAYKEWFDENYPQYSSIYEAVGLEEPIDEPNEPEYIPEPVFTPEPISDEVTINFQIDSQYSLNEIIRIEGEVSKIIPNTPITYQLSTDANRFTKSYEILSTYYPHLDKNGKFHMTIEFYECDNCTSGDVHLEFFYGQPDNHLASIKKSFYVDNKISKTSEKIQNYFPTDKYEIGTDVNFKERVPDLISPNLLASYWGSIWYMDKLNPMISISYFTNGDHVITGNLQSQKFGYGCTSPLSQECQNFNLHDFECVSVSSYSSSHEICENKHYQILENYGKQKVKFGETGSFYMNKIVDNIVENPIETEPEAQCGPGTTFIDGVCQIDINSKINTDNSGGCLIATATYGSELAPQVQQLRELRDNQLLQTESGTAFMSTFNDIYYSFSPIIADYERENPYFKEAVKLAITPMISTLSLMENAETESEVLSIGISVIALNLGMYLGVPAIVIVGIRKIK